MSMKAKADIVRRYGARVVPGDSTDNMIKEGVETLEICRKNDIRSDALIVRMVFNVMCAAGDLTAVDYEVLSKNRQLYRPACARKVSQGAAEELLVSQH